MHLCGVRVLVLRTMKKLWTPLLDFLKVAMNATLNITTTRDYHSIFKKPSGIRVFPTLVHEFMAVKCFVPFYIWNNEFIFAVPRTPASSTQLSRLFSELADYVWYGLLVTLVLTTCVVYFLIQGSRDFSFVILFVLQPLLVAPQSADFLRWRGRMFFINWLMFCFVLQSSYLCTLLSELTVPSNADALNSLDDLLKTVLPVHSGLDTSASLP